MTATLALLAAAVGVTLGLGRVLHMLRECRGE
jgi:hypothetical protein